MLNNINLHKLITWSAEMTGQGFKKPQPCPYFHSSKICKLIQISQLLLAPLLSFIKITVLDKIICNSCARV